MSEEKIDKSELISISEARERLGYRSRTSMRARLRKLGIKNYFPDGQGYGRLSYIRIEDFKKLKPLMTKRLTKEERMSLSDEEKKARLKAQRERYRKSSRGIDAKMRCVDRYYARKNPHRISVWYENRRRLVVKAVGLSRKSGSDIVKELRAVGIKAVSIPHSRRSYYDL